MSQFTVNLLCTIGGILITLLFSTLTFNREQKKESKADGKTEGVMLSDIGYIKAGVDDLKAGANRTAEKLDDYNRRITRCEESCKQAHHRIDEIKGEKTT